MPSIPSAGVSAAASFELAGLVPQKGPTPILADAINARSREVVSLTAGASVADGLVGYLIGLQRGSGAAVRFYGQRFRDLTHVDGEAKETIAGMVAEALKPATDSGTVRIEGADIAVSPGDGTQINGIINFRDLLANSGKQDRNVTLEEG